MAETDIRCRMPGQVRNTDHRTTCEATGPHSLPGKAVSVSRSIAKALYSLDKALVFFLGARQRSRIFSRINENIERDSIKTVTTDRGELRFNHLASAYVASGIERFHDDEPETLQWINSFQDGDIFWDVGANIGLYTLYAALEPGIGVYAFEPSALNYKLLVEHLQLNRLDEAVMALPVAFSDSTCVNSIFIHHDVPGSGSSLSAPRSQFGEYKAAFAQGIISYEMDRFRTDFNLPQPDHVKIDVDGMEPGIISGGLETLSGARSLLVEVEGSNIEVFDTETAGQLAGIGLIENEEARRTGSGRNRLYTARDRGSHPAGQT